MGYRVRVRAMGPKTGMLKGANREFEGITLEEAVVKQAELRGAIQAGGRSDEGERERYGDYATSLFKRKLGTGELKSAKSRERWAPTQDGHLIPAFGDWYIDQIRRGDLEKWKAAQSACLRRGTIPCCPMTTSSMSGSPDSSQPRLRSIDIFRVYRPQISGRGQ